MKKINYAMFVLALGVSVANAKPVTPVSAKTVAENFYTQNATRVLRTSTLVHTELAVDGTPLYYAYNINENDGFVIISGEDAVTPIVGYSTESKFVAPQAHSNLSFWLNEFSNGVNALRASHAVANMKTAKEWEKYTVTASNLKQANGANSTMTSNAILPLMQTTWNQSPYYNALCPSNSVTGCVATTMAQIMRYWSYPAQGVGSSSYDCSTANGFSNDYGILSATYTATYDWANMPLAVNSPNAKVAQLMFDCGVSVEMDYSPTGSGAQVLGSGGPSAQHSFINYFKYDPTQIHGLNRSSINNDTRWLDTIEHDLNIGRVVQYVGVDPADGGHTWVCDGYDQNNYLHMNWGWGGQSNGYFQLTNFATPGYNPSAYHQVLVGIVPKSSSTTDASVMAVTSPTGIHCNNSFTPVITLKNYGSSQLTSCVINYQIDGGAVQTQNWTGTLAAQQFITVNLPTFTSTAGTHTLTCYTSAPNNLTDQNLTNDQSNTVYTVNNALGTLPVVEGFENATSAWVMSHSGTTGVDWTVTTNAAATGVNSVMVDNMNNTSGNNSFLQTNASYDLSTFTTPALSFKAAYQQKATTNADKLQIFTSTDCGASWVSRRVITSSTLAALSGGVSSSPYMPSPSQFTTYTVNINAVAHNTSVMFRWEFLADANGVGNNLYLDDINIVDATATGIKNIETVAGLNIYPNPSHGNLNIAFNLTENHSIAVNVVDMLGRVVETIPSQQHTSGETVLTIGNKTYQAGVYFVNINIDGQQISKKIIME